jgi:cytosine/adenosine deaminase-related metal-dependent hydrolase
MKTLFFRHLEQQVAELGGLHNAHLHLDRANTLDDGYVDHGRLPVLSSSHISLQKKHALIRTVHEGPAYDPPDLTRRIEETVDVMLASGTRLADTMVDVTPDRVGLDALTLMQDIARRRVGQITIRAAAYTPFGFRDSEPQRWEVFEQGVALADFIGSLPEADDRADYPENIGFEEHCVRMLDLARRSGKMLHVHTDQRNIPQEDGTERLIATIRRTRNLPASGGEPQVWVVHMVSPSTYDEARWQVFVEGMLECNIGLICCPSAALGMRQIRPSLTPTFNSMPRVLELAAAGVPVRLGSDNVADMCSPSTTANLIDEVFVLSAALRFYDTGILAKFAAGVALDAKDRGSIRDHLDRNDEEIGKVVRRWPHK